MCSHPEEATRHAVDEPSPPFYRRASQFLSQGIGLSCVGGGSWCHTSSISDTEREREREKQKTQKKVRDFLKDRERERERERERTTKKERERGSNK